MNHSQGSWFKRYFSILSLGLGILGSANAENYKTFFRVLSSPSSHVTNLGLEGTLTWNCPSNTECRIQRARSLERGNWADYKIVNSSNQVNSTQLRIPIPESMVYIPGGTFLMGDLHEDDLTATNRVVYETPIHSVTLSPFYIDKYEVSNEKMSAVLAWAFKNGKVGIMRDTSYGGTGSMGVYSMENWGPEAPIKLLEIEDSGEPEDTRVCRSDLSFTGGENPFPIRAGKEKKACVSITYRGAMFYCNFLTDIEGLRTRVYNPLTFEASTSASGYRLPTEAEWEFAARAGTTNRYACGQTIDYSKANYYGNPLTQMERVKTTPVGSFPPNEFGLFDMTGNVAEWVQDNRVVYGKEELVDPEIISSNKMGVARGGSCKSVPYYCRTSYRQGVSQYETRIDIGIRVACSKDF